MKSETLSDKTTTLSKTTRPVETVQESDGVNKPRLRTQEEKKRLENDDNFEQVLTISDANERSEELAKLDLTEGQKDAAVRAARKDFLEGGLENDVVAEPEVKPLNNRAQKLIDELTAKGISVPYPSDFSKWDDATFERIEKLNR